MYYLKYGKFQIGFDTYQFSQIVQFHSEILASWNLNKNKSFSPKLENNHTLKCCLTIFQHNHICPDCWKNARSTFEGMVILQSREQAPDSCWKYGTYFSNHLDIYEYVEKLPEQHFSVWLLYNPGDKIFFLLKNEARIWEWSVWRVQSI